MRNYEIVLAEDLIDLETKVESRLAACPKLVPCGGAIRCSDAMYGQALIEPPPFAFSGFLSAVLATGFLSAVTGGSAAFVWWVVTR